MLLMTSYFGYNRSPLVCRNICERIRYKRTSFGTGGNYFDGKKYCRRCGVYCGMQLRLTSARRECKDILRRRKANSMKAVV
jgi:hypothetical protein